MICPKSHSKSEVKPRMMPPTLDSNWHHHTSLETEHQQHWRWAPKAPPLSLSPGSHGMGGPWLGSLLGDFCCLSPLDIPCPPFPSSAAAHGVAHAAQYNTESRPVSFRSPRFEALSGVAIWTQLQLKKKKKGKDFNNSGLGEGKGK